MGQQLAVTLIDLWHLNWRMGGYGYNRKTIINDRHYKYHDAFIGKDAEERISRWMKKWNETMKCESDEWQE